MNNLRLLAGLLVAVLPSAGVCAYGRTVVTLDEVFAQAEANSAQLRPSFSVEREAEHEISVARSARLPEIDASLSVSFLGDGFITRRDFSGYTKAPIPHLGNGLSVNITQPVFAGGAITEGIHMAELKSTASRFATDLKRDNIRLRLAGYYLDIYKCANLRRVVEANLDAARKVLEEMRSRYGQGTSLLNDITRYELVVSDLELQLTKIGNTLRILNSNLVTTAGFPEGTEIEPDTTILERSLPREGEEWWQTEARGNSSALSLARTGLDMSRSAEKLTKAERLPKVGLQACWTIDGPILVEVPPINRNLSYWFIGVGVEYNLSSLFKTNKKLASNRAAVSRAAEELEATAQDVEMAVRASHIRYLEAYEELRTREKGEELAQRNYHVVAMRYAEGMALITDMLDAANARLDAGRQLVNARINIINCYYKLLFTAGKI